VVEALAWAMVQAFKAGLRDHDVLAVNKADRRR
jgi:hypothetical protein